VISQFMPLTVYQTRYDARHALHATVYAEAVALRLAAQTFVDRLVPVPGGCASVAGQ
jgi:hypothetical protein